MTLNDQEIKHLTQAKLKQKIKQNKGWYFITLVQDLPNNRPYGFTLYDEPFVLLRTKNGGLVCYILLLDDEAKIPNDASVKACPVVEKEGMIWFWRGNGEEVDENLIPTMSNLEPLLED
ncbi:MAG: hypothetical protein QNJ34_09545 [Xenococcaceae cyanobacterium MO_188.B29]|nr:hypothetical protein [Xenococcaceae cyanobacterium MO_188.B29]